MIFNETTIKDVEFGILALYNNTNVQITGVDVSNAEFDGIFFEDQNSDIVISDTTVADVGWAGIGFSRDNNDIQITDVDIRDTGTEGIHLFARNTNVVISNARIDGAGTHGIQTYKENSVTITNNTTITNSAMAGISLGEVRAFGPGWANGGSNVVTIEDSTIGGAGEDGLFVTGNNPNTITMNRTTFTGDFGDAVIDIDLAGNTLSGDGHVFDGGGTFVDQFCEVTGAQTGSFGFDVGPQPTCP